MPSESTTKPTPHTLRKSISSHNIKNLQYGKPSGKLKNTDSTNPHEKDQKALDTFQAPNDDDGSSCSREEFTEDQGYLTESTLVSKDKGCLASPRVSLHEDTSTVELNQDNSLPYNVFKNRRLCLDEFSNEILTLIISHLSPAVISTTALVSKRFYAIVTSPHVWRIAFSRFFLGQNAEFHPPTLPERSHIDSGTKILSDTRFFNRLTGFASWRSEYVNRIRLLRSLERGKPTQQAFGSGVPLTHSSNNFKNKSPVITYSSKLEAPIDHIHTVFNHENNFVRFVHGNSQCGTVTASDPKSAKAENWGLAELQDITRFNELWSGHQQFGLDDGPTCVPNSMDLSQQYGAIVGEGFPGGKAYFQFKKEMHSQYLHEIETVADQELGIPKIPKKIDAVSAVWIAKSCSIPKITEGLVGMLLGSTLGVITAYSLGVDNHLTTRIPKGTVTAKWILSPGVPIIAFDVDDSYNVSRRDHGRIWAVALNALGELFYITKSPSSALLQRRVEGIELTRQAWYTGRTAGWNLVEPSLRIARDDIYHDLDIDASYTPRSSCTEMGLSKEQLVFETYEIEKFLQYPPAHFRKICHGWDMQQSLHVDFAGNDSHGAGEALFVIKRGVLRGQQAQVNRLTRWRQTNSIDLTKAQITTSQTNDQISSFIFPHLSSDYTTIAAMYPACDDRFKKVSKCLRNSEGAPEEWRSSYLSLGGHFKEEITCSGIDMSTYALLTVDEDPIYSCSGTVTASPSSTASASRVEPVIIPGHRARYLAVGTKTGSIIIWNMRGPQSMNSATTNEIHPLRTISTDSPQISCLALTALYIVHGGNDGLVQAWDLLASSLQPIRTLNSRSSAQARRRLLQAGPVNPLSSINLHSAGVISLDPDPTTLRGIVSLGTNLKYWEYSSSTSEESQRKKRRQRRSGLCEIHSNSDRFSVNGRGALKDFIATEYNDLKTERLRKLSEDNRLRCRFGVGLGGLTEDEALLYAEMISAQEFASHKLNQMEEPLLPVKMEKQTHSAFCCTSSSSSQGPDVVSRPPHSTTNSDFEQDIEEAIRLSLLDNPSNEDSA